MAKPIRPSDVANQLESQLPDAVIEAFNEIIAENYSKGRSSFEQNDVVARMVAKGLTEEAICINNYLDVESIYIKAGWEVEYDKPGYNESYEPTFTFRVKRK